MQSQKQLIFPIFLLNKQRMLICFQLFLVDNEDPKMFSLDCLNSDHSDGDSLDKISISQRPPLLAPDPDVLVFYLFFLIQTKFMIMSE